MSQLTKSLVVFFMYRRRDIVTAEPLSDEVEMAKSRDAHDHTRTSSSSGGPRRGLAWPIVERTRSACAYGLSPPPLPPQPINDQRYPSDGFLRVRTARRESMIERHRLQRRIFSRSWGRGLRFGGCFC